MLRDGLFSAGEFVKASEGFVLLRLKPGPAEALFGITAAPMAAVADWHGRVTVPDLNLRGDIPGACARLRSILGAFDFKGASRPPAALPEWGGEMVKPGGDKAVAAFLQKVHPIRGGRGKTRVRFDDLGSLYRNLELEGQLIQFCKNVFTAVKERTPSAGREYQGYDAEVALLVEMTHCRNDRIKFDAIRTLGAFGPVRDIGFFVKRAKEKSKNCRNPNVVLCNCLTALGLTAARFTGAKNRVTALEYVEIIDALPFLVEVLDKEGRNNSACSCARRSVEIIVESTGAPEALEAYLHALKAPKCDSDWMRKMTDRFHEKSLEWLLSTTGQGLPADFEAWSKWFAKNRSRLVYHRTSKRFLLDGRAAKARRAKLARAFKGR